MIVRKLLAELAETIDVRVLLWKGAPVPAFRPSRGDVRRARENLVAPHPHHERRRRRARA